jgi:hypothetical protein
VSTSEELLRKSSSFGLENREYGCTDLSHWPYGTLYLQTLALTSPSGGRSLGIVHSRTQIREFVFLFVYGRDRINTNMARAWYQYKNQPVAITIEKQNSIFLTHPICTSDD